MLKSSILAATLAVSAVALSGCLIIANDGGTRTVYVSAEETAAMGAPRASDFASAS